MTIADETKQKPLPCRKCGKEFDAKPYNFRANDWICLSCVRAKQREYRKLRKEQGNPVVSGKASREYRRAAWNARMKNPVDRFKARVRWQTKRAIEAGTLVRGPCEVCASEPAQAHHDDYTKPLEVRWLCLAHHAEHHAKDR